MKKKTLIFSILIGLLFGFLVANEVRAGSEHNVYGWAWSENIGWISFNSTNCDSDGNEVTDQGNYSQCPIGQTIKDYGVNIDSSGNFSGEAWADTIGWISFNSGDLGGCPSGVCEAKLDLNTYEVSGWARAYRAIVPEEQTLGGWDGWIRLRDGDYGVWLDSSVNPDPTEFRDWAWGGDDTDEEAVVGWISFNCLDTGICGDSNYKVMTNIGLNQDPSAINLDWDDDLRYCVLIDYPLSLGGEGGSRSSPPIRLNWTFDDPGDTQSAYEIEIDDSGVGFSTGKVSTEGPGPHYSYAPPDLSFGTQYWWRLKVWDSGTPPIESDWIDAPDPFTTDAHRWPNTKFTPDLTNPPVGEEVTFRDESTCYDVGGNPDTCQNLANSYQWDFNYPPFTPDFTQVPPDMGDSPPHTYDEVDNYTVRLGVTDDVGMCPYEYPLGVKLPLPTWREIAPF